MSERSHRLGTSMIVLAVLGASFACKPDRPSGGISEAPVTVERTEKFRDWVVARVGDREITYGEMDDMLESLPVFARMRYQTSDRRSEFLEAYVQYVVLGLASESDGYGRDPVVLERLKKDIVDRFVKDNVYLKVRTTDIPDQLVREYFDSHSYEFKAPARTRLSHLRVQDRVVAERLAYRCRKRFENFSGDIGEAFTQYVQRYSDDVSTKANGGDIGLFPRVGNQPQGVPEAVVEAGLKLTELFQVSPAVEADDGFHVLLRTGSVGAIDETFAQARPRIVDILMDVERGRLRAVLLADLSRRMDVKVNEDVVARVVAKVAGETTDDQTVKAGGAMPVAGGAH